MKEHPILFSGPMVRAILDGRKTQTRRVVNPQPKVVHEFYSDGTLETERLFRNGGRIRCPYGVIGDRLWVRETWTEGGVREDSGEVSVLYKASNDIRPDGVSVEEFECDRWFKRDEPCLEKWQCAIENQEREGDRWHPSIHMPRWASRITLEVVDLLVQRLQTISEQDAIAEGVPEWEDDPKGAFRALWDSINADRAPWDSNPWVWAVTFRRART